MNNKKFYILLTISLLSSYAVISQERKIGVQLEAGYGFGINEDFNSAQFFLTPLYKLTNQFSLGIGVGFKYYYDTSDVIGRNKGEDKMVNIPVYAAIDYVFPLGKSFHPFMNLKIGYGISSKKYHNPEGPNSHYFPIEGDVDNHVTGGFFISPAAGVAWSINEKHSLRLSLSYDFQRFKSDLSNNKGQKYDSQIDFENISLRLGWSL